MELTSKMAYKFALEQLKERARIPRKKDPLDEYSLDLMEIRDLFSFRIFVEQNGGLNYQEIQQNKIILKKDEITYNRNDEIDLFNPWIKLGINYICNDGNFYSDLKDDGYLYNWVRNENFVDNDGILKSKISLKNNLFKEAYFYLVSIIWDKRNSFIYFDSEKGELKFKSVEKLDNEKSSDYFERYTKIMKEFSNKPNNCVVWTKVGEFQNEVINDIKWKETKQLEDAKYLFAHKFGNYKFLNDEIIKKYGVNDYLKVLNEDSKDKNRFWIWNSIEGFVLMDTKNCRSNKLEWEKKYAKKIGMFYIEFSE